MANRKGKKGGWFGEKVRHSEATLRGKAKRLLGNQSMVDFEDVGSLENWKLERAGRITVWKNTVNPEYTVELVSWTSQLSEEEEMPGWGYGYPAKRGKGIPSSPDTFEGKEEAIEWAYSYMKECPNGYPQGSFRDMIPILERNKL